MNDNIRKAVYALQQAVEGSEFDTQWISGFANVLLHGHTDSDDDNPMDPKMPNERAEYLAYKNGASAGMAFVRAANREREI